MIKAGDKVRCTQNHYSVLCGEQQFTKGKVYTVAFANRSCVDVVADDAGNPNGWNAENFKSVSSLKPQAETVLRLLQKSGASLTHLEALAYGIWSLSSRASEIKRAGYPIQSTLKTDAFGKRYASYSLAA